MRLWICRSVVSQFSLHRSSLSTLPAVRRFRLHPAKMQLTRLAKFRCSPSHRSRLAHPRSEDSSDTASSHSARVQPSSLASRLATASEKCVRQYSAIQLVFRTTDSPVILFSLLVRRLLYAFRNGCSVANSCFSLFSQSRASAVISAHAPRHDEQFSGA